jgi:hypothetical protein
MEDRTSLEAPLDLQRRPQRLTNGESHLPVRPQYIEVPSAPFSEEQGSGLLLEYWDIVRRRKGTLSLANC